MLTHHNQHAYVYFQNSALNNQTLPSQSSRHHVTVLMRSYAMQTMKPHDPIYIYKEDSSHDDAFTIRTVLVFVLAFLQGCTRLPALTP